jgi:hypothetical protein
MEELADKEQIDEQLLRSQAGVDDVEEDQKKLTFAGISKHLSGKATSVRPEQDTIRDISYAKGPYNFSEANEFGLITR